MSLGHVLYTRMQHCRISARFDGEAIFTMNKHTAIILYKPTLMDITYTVRTSQKTQSTNRVMLYVKRKGKEYPRAGHEYPEGE